MPRYFEKITQKELAEKIDEVKQGSLTNLTDRVAKDLDKVKFDTENETCNKNDGWGFLNKSESLLGYNTLDNGLSFLGVFAGGDWETGVFFIIYWSGKELRGYIPTKGNVWNTITNQALGNDTDKDAEFLKEIFPKEYAEAKENGGKYWQDEFASNYRHIKLDANLLIQDIKERIIEKTPAKSDNKPSPKSNKSKSIQE